MTSKSDRRQAAEIAGWLEGTGPTPSSDPTVRAIARTAVLLVDALAPTPLHPVTRSRLYERALAEAGSGVGNAEAGDDPLADLWRTTREIPHPALIVLAAALAGAAVAALALGRRPPIRS